VEYRILGEHLPGGFAEYVVVPAVNLLELPDGFDWEKAAAAPLTFLTAWRGLVSRGRLRAGERVLVTGASGGVSTAAIQIARHIGAEVHAITTAPNIERVEALGARYVWDRERPDHRKQAFVATGREGFALILDSVGEATWHENIRALARAGRLVVYGATTGPKAVTDLRYLFWKQVDILGTTMSNRREFEAVMALVLAGELRPVIDRVYPLTGIAAAHRRLEAGAPFGKIVIRPEPRA
jgi:NADPH:quinone reductase-like Zn-dependent oxidoreductase